MSEAECNEKCAASIMECRDRYIELSKRGQTPAIRAAAKQEILRLEGLLKFKYPVRHNLLSLVVEGLKTC